MKMNSFCIKAFLTGALLCAVLLACGSSPAPVAALPAAPADELDAAGMDLDAAIREAAAQMGENLPGGTKAALVSVASSSAQFSEYVISRLEAALVSGKKLVVVDRANLDKIREEQGFQASGEVDDDSAKSIGKLLGAGAIVTGAFADLGDVYSLTLKAINIETATVAVSYPADVAKSTRIGTLLASGGGAGTARSAPSGGAAAQAQTAAPAATALAPAPAPAAVVPAPDPVVEASKTYKIGDTGPAGGIVFFDKGNSSGGWRYLEAAPSYMEVITKWGSHGVSVSGTGIGVGQGKQNTQTITNQQRQGESGTAAQTCQTLDQGGYTDWFLPSQAELNLMYINLKKQGLGGFTNSRYWSSSEYNSSYSWDQQFSNGDQDYNSKDSVRSVRPIRQF
jgi:hypothetical protein